MDIKVRVTNFDPDSGFAGSARCPESPDPTPQPVNWLAQVANLSH
jgi:hypothetical protein